MNDSHPTRIQRVLILGHKGFIGQHLERRFRKGNPVVEVEGRDLPETDLTSESGLETISNLLTPDTAVIMLSAIKRQFGDTLDAFNQNLKMTTNLCSLLQKKPVGRFIYFSSSAVYGEDIHNAGITEDTPVCPTSYYGIVKYTSERLYRKALEAYKDTSLLVFRPPTIYGPGDKGDTYDPVRFVHAAVRKEELTLWGDGTELREFIFIEDVADIVHQLTFSQFDGILNLASGTSYSFQDILNSVELISGHKLKLNYKARTKDKVDNAFLNGKLLKQTGGYDFTPLDKGIRMLYGTL